MNVRHMVLAISLAMAGCGGGSTAVQPIQPPPTIQHIPARSNVVAFMGDSITENWFWEGPPECETDPSCLHLIPVGSNFSEVDLGIGGNTTQQMLDRFQAQVIDASPQVGIVVIDGGVNDEHNGLPFTIDNIATMAHMAQQAGIKVIIASVMLETSPYWSPSANPTSADIEAFDAQLIALCQANGYLYADYKDVMLLRDGTEDFSLYMDGLHPNEAGYERMWPVLEPLIQEALQ